MSGYLILSKDPEGGTTAWRERGVYSGASAGAVVREFVAKVEMAGGIYLAIPERSAKTIRVKVETVQKVSVDAGEDG